MSNTFKMHIPTTTEPLVSCIMPTYNRRKFIPCAIRYFLRQDYKNKELIIIDDGADDIKDLVPNIGSVKYYRLNSKITLGEKLNLGCQYAAGNIIAHWDDDDWYAPTRLTYQVNALLTEAKNLCGINRLLYYDLRNGSSYLYIYPPDQRLWLIGSSLCYTRALWSKNKFANINVGMDGLFVWATAPDDIIALPDSSIAVHMIHDNNVSPKKTSGSWWHHYPGEEIRGIMNTDWIFYTGETDKTGSIKTNEGAVKEKNTPVIFKTIKNVYGCLVHEKMDCIIDLVRNLHYQDSASVIILYNGSDNANLLKSTFPFEKFGAVIHPAPHPVKHGYLHRFALDCMQFAIDNFAFDSFTCIDSDQLSIRTGYLEYLGAYLGTLSNTGLLSSRPERITVNDADNIKFWPAVRALSEYELWKPLLKTFPEGESSFVHWTFWPSSVFMQDAIRDLLKLFKENKQLQDIMTSTKIWATEEVILPTLVKLLGYEIVLNPCSYDFVKYRQSFVLQDMDYALNKPDAYWVHPVERQYEDANRKYIRSHFNQYLKEKKENNSNNPAPDFCLTLPLLERIKKIEGWLDDSEADLLLSLMHKIGRSLLNPNNIVEIGSYHGKSTVLFGSAAKAFLPEAKVYAIDPHDGKLGTAGEGVQYFSPSYEACKQNIASAGLSDVVEIIRDYSCNVVWQKPISLLFIDGLHDYVSVSGDFWHFYDYVTQGGYIAFHDYADYFPGVKTFVEELIAMGGYSKVHQVKSLVILQKV